MTYAEKTAKDIGIQLALIYDNEFRDLNWLENKINKIIADVKRGDVKAYCKYHGIHCDESCKKYIAMTCKADKIMEAEPEEE